MDEKLLSISQTAEILGVSIQTLRRWDKSGRLSSVRTDQSGSHRYYKKEDLDVFLAKNHQDIFHLAKNWVTANKPREPKPEYYCATSVDFQARLQRLEADLARMKKLRGFYQLISAAVGEIGNNSFDHNLGNWPDLPGIFFAYDLKDRIIVLADRGQGILSTLKKVKPELQTDSQALKTAFTEVISGRAPESRGNGLKFVKKIIIESKLELVFQSEQAILKINNGNPTLDIQKTNHPIHGCLAIIKY